MLERNFVKEKLAQGRPVLGIWTTLGSPMAAEVLAHAGLDFQILDGEHGPFQLDEVHAYVSRCERHHCSAIVRVPVREDWMILQALDQGAHGVIVPHVDDAAQARALVASAKYPPAGQRGFSPFTRAGGFSNEGAAAYPARANAFTLTAVLVESFHALERLDEILAVPELDVVYFGAYDLSQEVGVPGELSHAKVLKPVAEAVKRVVKAGKSAGGMVPQSPDEVIRLLDLGMRFITYDVDSALLFRPARAMVEWFAKETA